MRILAARKSRRRRSARLWENACEAVQPERLGKHALSVESEAAVARNLSQRMAVLQLARPIIA